MDKEENGFINPPEPLDDETAKKIIEATDNKIPVGFVTHLPEQEEIYKAAFSKEK